MIRSIVPLAGLLWLMSFDALASEDVERFTDGDAARGAPLYKRYCSGCHGADGRGGAHTFMPHIQNLTKKGLHRVHSRRVFV